jgi:hypothetical protein
VPHPNSALFAALELALSEVEGGGATSRRNSLQKEGQPARLFRIRNKTAFILAGALPSSTLLPEDHDGPTRQSHSLSFYGSTFWKTTTSQAAAILVGSGQKSLPQGEKGEP